MLFALPFDPSERVSGLRLVGLLIGMGGVVTLLGLDVGGDAQRLLGAALVLLAAAGYALGSSWDRVHSAFRYVDYAVVAGAVLLALYLLFRRRTSRLSPRA